MSERSSLRGPAVALAAVLTVLIAAVPVIAQRAPAVVVPSVPDNVAPPPAPEQPLPFSHGTHTSAGLTCGLCHVNPDPGEQMTLPATEICMSCHRAVATDRPAIVALNEYAESGRTIPWVRVYAITPGVDWSHRVHLDAGTPCATCHGDVGEADAVAETKAIRAMATCIGCHRASQAATDCVACHAWPTDAMLGIR